MNLFLYCILQLSSSLEVTDEDTVYQVSHLLAKVQHMQLKSHMQCSASVTLHIHVRITVKEEPSNAVFAVHFIVKPSWTLLIGRSASVL